VKTYYVYMLRCIDGTFYVGFTSDIEQRWAKHRYGEYQTCYTFMRRPLVPVYVGEFQTPEEGIDFEKRLKKWSHKKKRAFADHDWPLLKLLANKAASDAERLGVVAPGFYGYGVGGVGGAEDDVRGWEAAFGVAFDRVEAAAGHAEG
jgi:putative endonuclease